MRIEKRKQHCLYLQIKEFSKLARGKIYIQKSIEILCNSNNQIGQIIEKDPFTILKH